MMPAATGMDRHSGIAADDTTLQIQRRAADGNKPDEDYFLLTIDADRFRVPDHRGKRMTPTCQRQTRPPPGTFYGAMGGGPMMERRTWQIATDAEQRVRFEPFQDQSAGRGRGWHYLMKVDGNGPASTTLQV